MGVSAEGEFPAGAREGQAGKRLGASETHFAEVRAGPGLGWGFWPQRCILCQRLGGEWAGLASIGLEAESEGVGSWNVREEGGAPGAGLPREVRPMGCWHRSESPGCPGWTRR